MRVVALQQGVSVEFHESIHAISTLWNRQLKHMLGKVREWISGLGKEKPDSRRQSKRRGNLRYVIVSAVYCQRIQESGTETHAGKG